MSIICIYLLVHFTLNLHVIAVNPSFIRVAIPKTSINLTCILQFSVWTGCYIFLSGSKITQRFVSSLKRSALFILKESFQVFKRPTPQGNVSKLSNYILKTPNPV